ncbi:hypothetical protein F2Q68_00015588 [Brassica cretica]|uniref:Uncharacterized protein n=2 Tax=Brassica cretica TaxID=69181 RepID=A0A8S9HIW0_BRACR|nr:hypothetical protein F2Q68_00015588 [Brassica cretica]KAF3612052.1 hypothetical protein DY000_02048191 [Brassica cretica]
MEEGSAGYHHHVAEQRKQRIGSSCNGKLEVLCVVLVLRACLMKKQAPLNTLSSSVSSLENAEAVSFVEKTVEFGYELVVLRL